MDLFTVYVNLRCVGFSRRSADEEKTRAVSEDVLMREMFNRMGFLYNKHEYLNYLPGHNAREKISDEFDGDYICFFGEGPLDDFGLNHPLRIDFETIDLDNIMGSFSIPYLSAFRSWVSQKMQEDGKCMFLMQPTMQDVIDGWYYTEGLTHDDLWFCSDWKG